MVVHSKGHIIYAVSFKPKIRAFFSSKVFWGGDMVKQTLKLLVLSDYTGIFFSSYFPTQERRMWWWPIPDFLSPSAICWLSPRICSLFSFISIFLSNQCMHIDLEQIKLTIMCKLLPHTLHFPELSPHPACQTPPHSLWAVSSASLLSFSRGACIYLLNYWFQVLSTDFIIWSMILSLNLRFSFYFFIIVF